MNYESYERHADAIDDLQMISRIVRGSDTVFLAEVHGYAIGASCELALICDVAVTAVDAEFASRRRTSASLSRTG
jgi:enoyl-CoA hydratase/carnithine racemase